MEDIIDIIVTETTNTIEITSQSTDEVIDVNIIDNREDIVLNVTPTVVEININSLTGNFGVTWGEITGTLSNQTDLNTALGLKADLVGGKVPSSQLPSYVDDVVEVANYAALPATGETGKIYVILDTNKIYRWSGSVYVEIADSTAVWGAITGTLSSQTDLQNALNAKFDDPTGDTTQYIAGDGSLITFPVAGQSGTLVREVRNTTGATLTKGTIVYISGATGNKPTVSKAIATGDSTSAQTFGMCQANIANNSNGYVVCVGDITGLDTSALTEGAQLYLSSTTAGTYTTTKQLAPAHLVYIGVVTRSHPTQGQIEVKIQNGYELDEIHDVAISSVANNQGIFWESSTSLWKNKSIATVLGYTPANGADYLALAGGTMTGAIVGTTATFTNSGSGIGLGVTQSGASGDGIKITHSAGRAFNIQSSGSGYGVLINNETASTSAPFTIQKQGADKITFTDAGAGTFVSSLTASSFVKSGGTSAQFLKADGSVDSSTYVDTSSNQSIAGVKTFTTSLHASGLRFSESGGFGNVAGFTQIGGTADYFNFVNGTNTKSATFTYPSGGYTYALPASSGTLALTSALSSYLPLAGGTLTGALSGTSATFSGQLSANGGDFRITSGGLAAIGLVLSSNYDVISNPKSIYTSYGQSAILGGHEFRSVNGSGTGSITSAYGNPSGNWIFYYNVGIGTTSPSYLLHLVPPSTSADANNTNTGSTANLYNYFVRQKGASNGISGIQYMLQTFSDAGANGMEIYTQGASSTLVFGTNATERMRIASSGGVSIGTTSDTGRKFSVSGTINIHGANNAIQTISKSLASGGTTTFSMNSDYGYGLGDNISGLFVVSISEPTTDVANNSAVYVGTVNNPRGGDATIVQISKTQGPGITSFTVTNSGNSISVSATSSDGSSLKASLTFIGGGGTN
jgi:hypothetical protein